MSFSLNRAYHSILKNPASTKLIYTKDFQVKSREIVRIILLFSNIYLCTKTSEIHELRTEGNDGKCFTRGFLSEDLSLGLCEIIFRDLTQCQTTEFVPT